MKALYRSFVKKLLLLLVLCFFVSSQVLASVLFGGTDGRLFLADGNEVYTTGGYSIEGWVIAAAQGIKAIYGETSTGSDNPIFMIISGNSDTSKLWVFIRDNNRNVLLSAESTTTVLDGTPHHFLWADDNGTAKLYIDGVQDATDFYYAPATVSINRVGIGSKWDKGGSNWDSFLNGLIIKITRWDVVLTLANAEQLYNSRLKHISRQIQEDSRQGDWSFDDYPDGTDINGLTFRDDSDNGLIATGAGTDGSIVKAEEVLSYYSYVIIPTAVVADITRRIIKIR